MQLQSTRSVLRKVHNSYGSVTEFALQTRVRNWVRRALPCEVSKLMTKVKELKVEE